MSGINKVILIGRLGADPVSREVNGKVLANFSVATSETWNDKTGKKQEKTEWHNIAIWGRQAEIAIQYLIKGSRVYLEGKIQTEKFQDKNTGADKYITKVVLNGFDSKLQLLDSKNTQQQSNPSPLPQSSQQSNQSSQQSNVQVGAIKADNGTDGFEDEDIPF